jgi:general secretion pathway protein I
VRRAPHGRLRRLGFTLVEVMLALAILGVALVILVKSVAGNITSASEAFYMGVATDLARGKMYDLEEELLQEGFQEDEQELEGDFAEEGWPAITWKATITPTELPSLEQLMAMQQQESNGDGAGSGAGSGSGDEDAASDFMTGFQDSALGGLMSMLGGSVDASDVSTAGFLTTFYPMVQQVLKASIRKIKLTVHYDSGLRKEQFEVVLYVTEPGGMAKTLGAMWKQ